MTHPNAPKRASRTAERQALTTRLHDVRWLSPDAGLDLLTGAEREWLDARHDEFRAALARLARPFEAVGALEAVRSAPEACERWTSAWRAAMNEPNARPPLVDALAAEEASEAPAKVRPVPKALRRAVESAVADAAARWGGPLVARQTLGIPALRVIERQWAWLHRAPAKAQGASPWAALLEVWMRGAWPLVLPDGGWLVFLPVWKDARGVADPSHAQSSLSLAAFDAPGHEDALEALGLGPPPRITRLAGPVRTLFAVRLPAALARDPEGARKIGGSYQFNIADEGRWALDLTSDPPVVREGQARAPEATIEASGSDFEAIMANPGATTMRLFFAGRLKILGNPMLGMNLQKILALT